MIVLDISIVITALPEMVQGLGFSATGLSWVQNAYTLAIGGLPLLGAAILAPSTLALLTASCRPYWNPFVYLRLLFSSEGSVEGGGRRLEVYPPYESRRLPPAVHSVHARVLPLHGEGPIVADAVQRADDGLEVYSSPAY